MKATQLALAMLMLAGLACGVQDIDPEYFCVERGGVWHKSTEYADAFCEEPTPKPSPQTQPQTGESETEVPFDLQEAPTEKYASPTPASAQECNATLYVQALAEVVKEVRETYYRECDYKLALTNIHPSEGVWIVRRTNTSTHFPPKDCDSCYWYSDLLFPEQAWEKTFRATFYSDGKASFEYVDKVAGVFNRPECLYLLNSPEVEAISQPVQWACAP